MSTRHGSAQLLAVFAAGGTSCCRCACVNLGMSEPFDLGANEHSRVLCSHASAHQQLFVLYRLVLVDSVAISWTYNLHCTGT